MSEAIQIATITISKDQRALRPWKVQHIAAKMRAEGYNPSYPVTLDALGVLVDGGHRIAAARSVGITEVPYVLKQEGVSRIRHAIRCNEDGTDTERHDVFDLAELCWQLAEDGWTGQAIADELGWSRVRGEQFRAIREKLHPLAWSLARWGVTNNVVSVTPISQELVTSDVTKVTVWRETHLRALIQHLAYDGDRAMMRAQVKAVRAVIARGSEKDKRFGQTEKKVNAVILLTERNRVERAALARLYQALAHVPGYQYSERTEAAANVLRHVSDRLAGAAIYELEFGGPEVVLTFTKRPELLGVKL